MVLSFLSLLLMRCLVCVLGSGCSDWVLLGLVSIV